MVTSRSLGMVAAGAATLAAAGIGYAWRESKRVELTETVISIADLPPGLDGLRILHIADTHFPANGASLPRFLEAVASLDYDIVFATGDYAESESGWPVVREAFRRIDPKLGIYAVIGGHERYAGVRSPLDLWPLAGRLWRRSPRRLVSPAPLIRDLESLGVHVLVNQSTTLEIGGEMVRLIGIDDAYLGLANLEAALPPPADTSVAGFSILLSHSPDGVLQADGKAIPLALSGHTHGGQIRLPGYGAPVRHAVSVDRLRPAGLVQIGETQVYISRGFGTAGVPLRFACRPEVGV
ncbi:MAG: metallophosphoesterase, partial [Dehalococcoidia bacterium]